MGCVASLLEIGKRDAVSAFTTDLISVISKQMDFSSILCSFLFAFFSGISTFYLLSISTEYLLMSAYRNETILHFFPTRFR